MTLKKADNISYIVVRGKFNCFSLSHLCQQTFRGVKGKLPLAHDKLPRICISAPYGIFGRLCTRQNKVTRNDFGSCAMRTRLVVPPEYSVVSKVIPLV